MTIGTPKFQTLASVAAAVLGLILSTFAQAADEYQVNVILPITGNASFVGVAHRSVLKLAEEVMNKKGGLNGRSFELRFYDDQTSPQVAVQSANEILASKPAVMIGSSLVAMCNAELALVKNGPFTYCISPGIYPPAGSYMFSGGVATKDLLQALFSYIRNRGWTRVASITSTDATGQDIEGAFDQILNLPDNKEMKLVQRARFTIGDLSVAAQMANIKASNPDILIAWTTGGAIATIFKSVLQVGLDIPVATTNGNQSNAIMGQFAAFLPKTLYVPTTLFPQNDGLFKLDPRVEDAQQIFYETVNGAGLPNDYMSAGIWDAAVMTLGALQKLGPSATAAQVRDYMGSQSGLPGINGLYDFKAIPQRGLDYRNALVTRWTPDEKKWTVVSGPAGTLPVRQ
jgi:branched-chain amino acid transport system substrate-binding protein